MILKYILLPVFSLFTINLSFGQADRFYLTGTHPQQYETGVDLETSIHFTFSEPVDVSQSYADGLPVGILYAGPEDSLTLSNFRFNDDHTIFFVDAVHTPDTEFTWVISAATSGSGKTLNPETLNYSTSADEGTTVITGNIGIAIPTKSVSAPDSTHYLAGAFALSASKPVPGTQTNKPEALFYTSPIVMWEGNAEIKNVKPGTYWPVAFTEWTVNGEFSYDEYDGFGYYNPDYDQQPDSIVVEAGTDSLNVNIEYGMGTSLEPERQQDQPKSFTLHQNYPNPFNPTTKIRFELNSTENVSLSVFDLTGRKIRQILSNDVYSPGLHSVNFDGSELSSGIYIYQLQTSAGNQTRQMILVK